LIPGNSTDFEKAYVYSIILDSYIELENLDSSLYYMGLIEPILAENNFDLLQAFAYQYKGRILFLKKQYQKSILFLKKSIELFNKNKSIESFSETCKHIAKAYAALNKNLEAYQWQLKADSFKDSLNLGAIERELTEFEQENIRKIELHRNKLEMELKQQKILNTNFQIRARFRLAIAALFLLSVIIAIVVFYYRTTRKNNKILSNKNKLIEEQKQLLEEQVIKLEENEKKLRELNATKDKFFSIIAHDLRNPLQSIISLSGLFLQNDEFVESRDMTKILASMNKTANYGVSLLENLLAWSRSQTGNIVPVLTQFEMDKIIRHLVLDFKAMAESKHITFDFHSEGTSTVFADKNMIITVARNLLHNAIKFSFENSVVKISIIRINNEIVTSVSDEGIGMTKEELARLFRIDSPVKKSGTHKETGSGLGLILCKEFVEKNGGKLKVDCKQQKGCTFYFSLPIYNENKAGLESPTNII
ncbi:MAG: HAMP domain-containing histidine kinase, partial [Prolixibacteraceae bacterium]|nr:HAMP domain-containing histidine kinase [Prolixibacteraceae bacterium]